MPIKGNKILVLCQNTHVLFKKNIFMLILVTSSSLQKSSLYNVKFVGKTNAKVGSETSISKIKTKETTNTLINGSIPDYFSR